MFLIKVLNRTELDEMYRLAELGIFKPANSEVYYLYRSVDPNMSRLFIAKFNYFFWIIKTCGYISINRYNINISVKKADYVYQGVDNEIIDQRLNSNTSRSLIESVNKRLDFNEKPKIEGYFKC